MSAPHGASVSVNVPSTAVVVVTIGAPDTSELHVSQDTPAGNAVTP